MSVLVCNRKESKFEVIVFSEELHKMLIELMSRNFGVKDMRRFVRGKGETANMPYFQSVMDCSKMSIQNAATSLTNHIRAANSIYPKIQSDWEQRRSYQNAAIADCEQIIKELQHVIDIFDIDINIYDRYVNAIDREIGLIKKWRQKDYQNMPR